jgi:hypothetical protein
MVYSSGWLDSASMVAMCNAGSDSLVGNWAISTVHVTSVARSTGTSADSRRVCDGLWKLMLVYNIRVQPFPSPDGDVKPSKQRQVEAGSKSEPMHSEYLPHLLSHVTANDHTQSSLSAHFLKEPIIPLHVFEQLLVDGCPHLRSKQRKAPYKPSKSNTRTRCGCQHDAEPRLKKEE